MLLQPMVQGARHMIVAGHYLATEAGHAVLRDGGNAIDAGVAAGIALNVLHSEQVQFSGVAPMIIYHAERGEVMTISGLGWWPRATRPELFIEDYGGSIPMGILRTVVPAAPDAWILALERFGTMSFGDVASTAVRYAREGFIVHPMMAYLVDRHADYFRQWEQNAAIYLPNGAPPSVGDLFIQPDLAATLQYMIDEERVAARGGRLAGLQAARNAFYRGDLATTMIRFHREQGGWLTAEDLADYRSEIETAIGVDFRGLDVFACGPWCQGPALQQMLKLIEYDDLLAYGHNSPAYIHLIAEAMKLSFADRDRYFADPRFVSVPMAGLLSDDYASVRRSLICSDRALPGLAPFGIPAGEIGVRGTIDVGTAASEDDGPRDTSYVGVVDRFGNAFSASPSDVAWESPVIPGMGLCLSSRGSQSWADSDHPASVRPGKRPRLTPSPAIAMKRGQLLMPFGAPGGDLQPQGMLQAFLNHVVFGMSIQEAVEAPRFATHSFPGSFEPHPYYPNRLDLEKGIDERIGEKLASFGHDVRWLPELSLNTAGVCAVVSDLGKGVLSGGADPRRSARAMGW